MLKKFHLLCSLIIALFLCLPLSAEVISTEVAKQTANTFLTLDNEWHGETDACIQLVEHEGTPAYYVIEYTAGGWAIVSAQSSSSPIIGYSTEGEFAAPGAMELLLDFNAQIISARARDYATVEHKGWKQIKERKKAKETNNTPDVAPLIKINLNQSAPFNNYCPEIEGEKTLVGCVAVAMTQAMMVQRYPQAPQGEYSYYCGEVGTLSIDYNKEKPYDWDAMYNGNMDEVARLAYHSGLSVEMGYGVYSSGAVTEHVATALPRYFGYDAKAVRYVTKTNDIKKWLETILGELTEGRAVIYRGQSGGGGHCWNVDGWKQSTQMVHCNWGWDGIGNGYFDINNMTDSYQGLSFLAMHAAVIGVGAPTTAPYDIVLSKCHYPQGTQPGTPLADVKVFCGDKDASFSYELYSKKDANGYTQSPYTIENGQLFSTETITTDNAFKHLFIKVTNTNNGKCYEKEFDIHITTQDATAIEGTYTATAQVGVEEFTSDEWQINITIDKNDSNKVWLHPLCYFKNLEAQYINPVYATYDAERGILTMPVGQTLFKRSGYNMVSIVSYNGTSVSTTGDVELQVSIDNGGKKITIDPNYILGVGDANNNYMWEQSMKKLCLTQESGSQIDINLSTTQFYYDAEIGVALADVIITGQNPDATFAYEVFGPQDANLNYTPSPYDIVDGTLVTTEPITDSDRFRYVLIRATDTHTGEWIDKGFYINIIDLYPRMLAGEYYAYAKSSFRDFPDEEWRVSITIDESDNNKLWIKPVWLVNYLDAEKFNPIYATFDTESGTISMPMGQTLYEDGEKTKLIIASSTSASNINTTGVAMLRVHKSGDVIEISYDSNNTFGVGNAIDDSWWFQALHDIVYSNREIIAVDDIYYNITDSLLNHVEVTYRGVDFKHYADEYYGDIIIPATIMHKDATYTVSSIAAYAFYNCGYLYTIELPNTITEIGEYAFAQCDNLGYVAIMATTPPTIYASTFDRVNKSIPLYVPAGCAEAYRNAPYWCEFTYIDDSSDVDNIAQASLHVGSANGYITIAGADNDAIVNIYSLCGMLLHNTTVQRATKIELPHGIYLVQVDGSTHKVVI